MLDYQYLLFSWMASQHWLTGMVLLLLGLLYAFQGFRMAPFLVGASCALLGWVSGIVAGAFSALPGEQLALVAAGSLAATAVWARRAALVILGGGTFLFLGHYLALQLELPAQAAAVLALVAGGLGGLMSHLCPRTMLLVLTSLYGTVFMIAGFVGLSTHILPSVGDTFCDWARDWSLLVPGLMAMLCITGYSIQFSGRRGDIRTG